MATRQIDEAKLEAFMGKAIGDFSGTMSTMLATVGDRLGLFGDLASNGPASSRELAERTGIDERYAAEWLRGMAAAGYLEWENGRYVLPPEQAQVFAQEAGPFFLCGGFQMLTVLADVIPSVVEAFRKGGGVPQDSYQADMWDGMDRFTASWTENLLLGDWLPALPHLQKKLEEGCEVADVGCGAGRAVIKFAESFPNSRIVGYDIFEGQVERARQNAEDAGVADRVRFEVRDVVGGLDQQYDIVTTFDVVHDAADPLGLIKGIREGVKDDGSYLMLEINCADRHEDNEGPLAAMFYGFSVFYCMTTSLANGGAGLGTCGMPEAKVRELCREAGFETVERAPITDNPFNVLYEIKP